MLLTLLISGLGVAVAKFDPKLDKLFQTLTTEEFVAYFNKQNYSYTIANSNLPKCTNSLGLLPSTNGSNLPMEEFFLRNDFNLPVSFDSREIWTNCPTIGEIYDQGQCGSCWTFATANVASDRTCIHTDEVVRLSEEDFECQNNNVCMGGAPEQAFQYWVDTGLVTRDCKPYDIYELLKEQCIQECVNGQSYADDKHFGEKAYQVQSDVSSIKAELVSKGPVEAGIVVYNDFELYKSGVYEHKFGSFCGHHAVRIIGYGVENDEEYWLVTNSWGTNWGLDGLIKMKMKDQDVQTESMVYTGLPKRK